MSRTLLDVDDDLLAQARTVLGATTKRETVNKALAEVVALAARRRDLDRLHHGLPADLADPGVNADAWR